jgi:hypothetical protein
MDTFLHTLERETIHLGLQSPPIIALGIMFIIAMLRRILRYEWMPQRTFPTAVWASIVTFVAFALREAFDVGVMKDWWGKSYIDYGVNLCSLVLLCLAIRKLEQWAKRGCL